MNRCLRLLAVLVVLVGVLVDLGNRHRRGIGTDAVTTGEMSPRFHTLTSPFGIGIGKPQLLIVIFLLDSRVLKSSSGENYLRLASPF